MNAAPKFTPGPWRLSAGMSCIDAPNGRTLLDVDAIGCESEDEHYPNARLIAAAPKLFAACEAVEAAQRSGDYAEAFAIVRAALADASPNPADTVCQRSINPPSLCCTVAKFDPDAPGAARSCGRTAFVMADIREEWKPRCAMHLRALKNVATRPIEAADIVAKGSR